MSWLAIKDTQIDEVFEKIGLHKTGDTSEAPDFNLCYRELNNGWHVIILNGDNLMTSKTDWLRKLSGDKDVFSVFVEEHVMYSSACCFRSGKRSWFIEHDSSRSLDDIKTSGKLPDSYRQIYREKSERLRGARGCDYIFDVPIKIVQMLTGYSHCGPVLDGENEIYWNLAGEEGDPYEHLRDLLTPILRPKGFQYFKSTQQFRRISSNSRDEITIQLLGGYRVCFYFGVLHLEVAETISRLKNGPAPNEYSNTMRHSSSNAGPSSYCCLQFRINPNDWCVEPAQGANNSEVFSEVVEFIKNLVLPYLERYQNLEVVREDLCKNSRVSLTCDYEQVLAIDLLWNDKQHVHDFLGTINQRWHTMADSCKIEFLSFYNSARSVKPDVFPELVADSNQFKII